MGFEDTFRSVALSIVRFAGYAANAFIFGLVPLLLLVLRPSFKAAGGRAWEEGRRRLAYRLEDMFQACLVASAVATLIALVLQAALVAQAQGGDVQTSSLEAIASTSFGRWHLLRFPLLAGLSVLLVRRIGVWSLAGTGDGRRAPGAVWWVGWTVLALVLLATSSASGHAVVARPLWVSVTNDLVHLAAGGVWLTGIIVLAVMLPDTWRDKDEVERIQLLTPAVVRFSTLAAVMIAVIAVTGTLNSFLHVGRLSDFIETSYGVALSLKIGVFIGILAIGGVNHFLVRRRLERALEKRGPTAATSVFRKTIAIELALGLAVMVMTGILTGLARTKPSEAPPPPEGAVSDLRD